MKTIEIAILFFLSLALLSSICNAKDQDKQLLLLAYETNTIEHLPEGLYTIGSAEQYTYYIYIEPERPFLVYIEPLSANVYHPFHIPAPYAENLKQTITYIETNYL
jgi:hypothetical protein